MIFVDKFDLDHDFDAISNKEITKINILKNYKDKYIVLVFYPFDFTTVCPTEINKLSDMRKSFEEINAELLLISCDSVFCHNAWLKIPRKDKGILGCELTMISDYERILSSYFGLLEQKVINGKSVDSNSSRSTVILNKNHEVIHYSFYKKEIGRNSSELLRIVKADIHNEKTGEMCLCDSQFE